MMFDQRCNLLLFLYIAAYPAMPVSTSKETIAPSQLKRPSEFSVRLLTAEPRPHCWYRACEWRREPSNWL